MRAARRSVLERAGFESRQTWPMPRGGPRPPSCTEAGLVLVDSDVHGGCLLAVRCVAERAPSDCGARRLARARPGALLAAVRAGASGFVPETLGASGLVRAVEVALRGDAVIPRAGVGTLIEQLRGGTQEQTSVDGLPLQLTRREADVFARMREGMSPKQIAFDLELSAVTVRRHLSSVARKARQARPLNLALESTS